MLHEPDIGDLRPEVGAAIEAVRWGLEVARSREGADDVTSKGGRDLVTATDIAVEDAIRSIVGIGSAHPIVGEERGGEAPADGSPYWLLDPICGTRNFASGIPLYAVNLAFVDDGRIDVAAVGDASVGEILFAERGRGAWAIGRDGQRRLNTTEESQTVVIESGTAGGPSREHAARFSQHAIRANRWDIRNFSSTLSEAYVAAGRMAAYVLFSGLSLHTGAGTLLVTEAGGTISDIDGAPWTVASSSLLACANLALHGELLDMVRATARAEE